MRIVTLLILSTFAVSSRAAAPSVAPYYSVTELRCPVPFVQANATHQVVGSSFFWENGKATDLGRLPGDSWGQAIAMNNHGLVLADSGAHAFLWKSGKKYPLGFVAIGEGAGANCGLNDNGLIVQSDASNLTFIKPGRPIVYKGFQTRLFQWQNGHLIDLGSVPGLEQNDKGHFINNKGDIAGENGKDVFFWSGGKRQVVCATTGIDVAEVASLNDVGEVAGTLYKWKMKGNSWGFPSADVFLWSNGKLQVLPSLLGCTRTLANGLNNTGQVIGHVLEEQIPEQRPPVPLLWQNGKVFNLNDLIPKSHFVLTIPRSINDKGEIVCQGYEGEMEEQSIFHGDFAYRTYLLTPVTK